MGIRWHLRRVCRQMLRDLDLWPPPHVPELCTRVGLYRGRRVVLVPHAFPADGPTGEWKSGDDDVDYILFQQATSRVHQDHIVVVALAHLLACDVRGDRRRARRDRSMTGTHGGIPGAGPRGAGVALSGLRVGRVDDEVHRDAETVATIIQEWRGLLDIIGWEPSADSRIHRLEAAFGGWGS